MNRPSRAGPDDLYATDLTLWTDTQAHALEEGRFGDLDHANLAAFVDRLGTRERHDLRARLGIILTGLLRWAEQVDLRCHGWAATLDIQRLQVDRCLAENASLRSELSTLIATEYPAAKARAVLESALFDDTFSESCPFSESEILMSGFYPDPYGDDAIRGEGWWMRQGNP